VIIIDDSSNENSGDLAKATSRLLHNTIDESDEITRLISWQFGRDSKHSPCIQITGVVNEFLSFGTSSIFWDITPFSLLKVH
jgi:hypothetical protein